MDNLNEQINQQKQILDTNPDDFDANYSLGNILYQAGQDNFKEADAVKGADKQEYDQLFTTGQKMTEDSMPFMEKAFDLKPDDGEVYSRLESIYTVLGMDDKIKGINERIKDTQ